MLHQACPTVHILAGTKKEHAIGPRADQMNRTAAAPKTSQMPLGAYAQSRANLVFEIFSCPIRMNLPRPTLQNGNLVPNTRINVPQNHKNRDWEYCTQPQNFKCRCSSPHDISASRSNYRSHHMLGIVKFQNHRTTPHLVKNWVVTRTPGWAYKFVPSIVI